MRNFITALLLSVLCGPLHAAPRAVTTALVGTFNRPQENGCLHVSRFYYRVDCGYQRATGLDPPVPWVGPTVNAVYYPRGSPHALPSAVATDGDDRRAPALSATLTVHTRGTAAGADDRLSGVFTVGPAARRLTTRTDANAKPRRAVESWLSITHTLAETSVSAARRNDAGGFDYVLGQQGFPVRLCLQSDPQDCFPSGGAPLTTDGQWAAGVWAAPAAVGVAASPALAGNVGAPTRAVIEGYHCADTSDGAECARGVALWGARAGLDNLLLEVSTDAQGRVLAARGYWTTEYRVDAGPPALQAPEGQANSWTGGYLELQNAASTPLP